MRPTKSNRPEYAERIAALRSRLNLKQIPFARRLRVDQGSVSKWESGRNQPEPKMFVRLASMAGAPEKEWFLAQAGLSEATFRKPAVAGTERRTRVDPDLLAWVLQALDSACNLMCIVLPLKKYAEIIARVYDDSQETGQRDATMVEREVRATCVPPNEKVR